MKLARNITILIVFFAWFTQSIRASWDVSPLVDVPDGSEVKAIKMKWPSGGPRADFDPELIKEFLSDGKKLQLVAKERIRTTHPEIWEKIGKEVERFRFSYITVTGVFVDEDYMIFGWKFVSPNVLEVSNYVGTQFAYFYLENPKRPLTIQGETFAEFWENSNAEARRNMKERELSRAQEQKNQKDRESGLPDGLEPVGAGAPD